jgi:hypothetical protein
MLVVLVEQDGTGACALPARAVAAAAGIYLHGTNVQDGTGVCARLEAFLCTRTSAIFSVGNAHGPVPGLVPLLAGHYVSGGAGRGSSLLPDSSPPFGAPALPPL